MFAQRPVAKKCQPIIGLVVQHPLRFFLKNLVNFEFTLTLNKALFLMGKIFKKFVYLDRTMLTQLQASHLGWTWQILTYLYRHQSFLAISGRGNFYTNDIPIEGSSPPQHCPRA